MAGDHHVYPFAIFMGTIWVLWLLRVMLARRYRPWRRRWVTTTSVIIPVVDEPMGLFRSVLERISAQDPDQIIVVVNGPRNPALELTCAGVNNVACYWTDVPGKRNALRIGLEKARGEIAVLVDSDTIWTDNTLDELVKPFRDPHVGGVTTRQRILEPGRSVLTRWADWLESVRSEYSMPAMSVLGTVGCLPGRTIAFRTKILRQVMDDFLHEPFLGFVLEVSDDRTLTNLTLKAGYRTVYQSTSLVYTDAPLRLRKLIKQQLRWARGSQYNTLRMLPWMFRNARTLALFYISDIMIPFMLIAAFVSWTSNLAAGARADLYEPIPLPRGHMALAVLVVLAFWMSVVSIGLRFGRHFAYQPFDVVFLPVFMIINSVLLMPIRILGFFRMGHNSGWGTRASAFAGTQVQNPQALIPYTLGTAMLALAVAVSL
ncbi:MAG: glycosyltransferase family 2 protein [Micromonosporaceae bacterium]